MSIRQRLARLERVEEREPADLDELIERCLEVVGQPAIDAELERIAEECNVSEDAVRGVYRAAVRTQEHPPP